MIGLERFGGDVWKQEPERKVNEVKHVLKAIAWRRVIEYWRVEGRGRPKLEVLGS